MTLSKAQQEVITKAKEKIDFARTHTLKEWAMEKRGYSYNCRIITNYIDYGFKTKDAAIKYIEDEIEEYAKEYAKVYENENNAIVLTYCNSKTLKKLEQLGLIEIIFDSNGYSYGIDTIKVVNY